MAILENYSRAILASAVTLSQDTNAYLSVLHATIGRHGSPKAIVTGGGGIFRSDRPRPSTRAEHRKAGDGRVSVAIILETNFNPRDAWRNTSSPGRRAGGVVREHDLWLERHNTQKHKAHEGREDGRRSPSEVLARSGGTPHPVDLSGRSSRPARRGSTLRYARQALAGLREEGSPSARSPSGWRRRYVPRVRRPDPLALRRLAFEGF